LKRFFDVALSIVGLVMLAPIVLLLAAVIRLKLGTPVLFVQERSGLHGRPFKIIKFRSMTDTYDKNGRLLSDVDRLTGFGKWLRSTSLDELPELWNVLKGEMSIVGPRPLLLDYLPLYSDYHRQRHDVLPGITGWAQVNGRNALSWDEKFNYDVWYVDNNSFGLDLKIILMTVRQVMLREKISAEGNVSMPKFTGYDK
jgi:sugar transferase EpsL